VGHTIAAAAEAPPSELGRGDAGSLFGPFVRHPALSVVAAALFLSMSGILVRFSDASPSTAATLRSGYALPFLAVVAWAEQKRLGPRSLRARRAAWIAGVFFAADLTLFHHGIELMGAGLATVFGNLQVLFVGAVAWLFLGERPTRALVLAVPVALAGVLLISGIIGGGAYGANPGLGVVVGLLTAASYAGYLLVLRRGQTTPHVAGPIFDASLACTIAAAIGGIIVGDLNLVPSLPEHAWLLILALTAQFGGGLLIAVALPRMPAVTTSLILLVQPVLAVVFSVILLSEAPSPYQVAGVGLVLVGVALGTLPIPWLSRPARADASSEAT